MKTVAITAAQDSAASVGVTVSYTAGASTAWFTIPGKDKAPSEIVDVHADGTDLYLFPERSSGQAKLLSVLGLT